MRSHRERMAGAKVSKDLRDMRRPVPMQLVSRIGGKRAAKQNQIDEENKALVKLIYETMKEERVTGSYEYAPGYRVTKGGKAIIDCYPTELGGDFHKLHSGEAIAKREKQRQERHTKEFFERVSKAKSPYSQSVMNEELKKQKQLMSRTRATKIMPWAMYLLRTTNPDVPQSQKEVDAYNKERNDLLRQGKINTAGFPRPNTAGATRHKYKWSDYEQPKWNHDPTVSHPREESIAASEHIAQVHVHVAELKGYLGKAVDETLAQRPASAGFGSRLPAAGSQRRRSPVDDAEAFVWGRRPGSATHVSDIHGGRPKKKKEDIPDTPYQRELQRRGISMTEVLDNAEAMMQARASRPVSAQNMLKNSPYRPDKRKNKSKINGKTRRMDKKSERRSGGMLDEAQAFPPLPSTPLREKHRSDEQHFDTSRQEQTFTATSSPSLRPADMQMPLVHGMERVPGSPQKVLHDTGVIVEEAASRSVHSRRVLVYECAQLAPVMRDDASDRDRYGCSNGNGQSVGHVRCDVRLYDVGFIYPREALELNGQPQQQGTRRMKVSPEGYRVYTNDFVPLSFGIEIDVTAHVGGADQKTSAVLSVESLRQYAAAAASSNGKGTEDGSSDLTDDVLCQALGRLRCLHDTAKLYDSLGRLDASTEEQLYSTILRMTDVYLTKSGIQLILPK